MSDEKSITVKKGDSASVKTTEVDASVKTL
jgi:hypothetical protein